MANEIPLDILVRLDKSINDIQKFREKTESSLKSIQKSANAISFVQIGRAAIDAGKTIANAISGALGKVIDASLESEDAILRLEASLRLTNTATKQNVARFSELATEMQNITGISDEVILGQISYVKALGATNDQTEKVIRTATNLSAAIGGDLQSNVQILVDTFSGTIPRSLAKSIPELNKFTDAQLKSGAAVDFLNKKYPDFAKQMAETNVTKIKILKENFNDLLETVGSLITKSTIYNSIIDSTSIVTSRTKQAIDDYNRASNEEKTTEFLKQTGVIGAIINLFRGSKKAITENINEIDELKKAINKFRVPPQGAITESGGLGSSDTKKALEETLQKIKSVKEQLKGFGLSTPEVIKNDLKERLAVIDQAHEYKQITDKEATELRKKAEMMAEDELSKYRLKKTKDLIGLNLFDEKGNIQLPTNATEGAALGVGVLGQSLQGEAGARKVVSAGATIAGTAMFGKEAGQVIGAAAELLTQSSEQVKQTITSFMNAIPTLIENIILNIPTIIDAFIEGVPRIIDRLISELPRLIQSLIEKLPHIAISLATMMPMVATKLALEMPRVAVEWTTQLVKSIPLIVKGFVDEIGKQMRNLGGLLGTSGEGGGIGGFVGGAVKSIGKIFKFADGGIVPSGFPNDSAPALLTSGEIVLNKDGVDNMISAFNSLANRRPTESNGSQNISINLQVGEKQLADVLLQLNRNGFRTV